MKKKTTRTVRRGFVAKLSRAPSAQKVRVRFYRDPDDGEHWIARAAPDSLGVHSFGRTIEEARRRLREALALAIGDEEAQAAVFIEEIDLPADAKRLIEEAKTARASARALEAQATETQRHAAELLTGKMGLSLRDAGELLEVSHVAVAKVLGGRA